MNFEEYHALFSQILTSTKVEAPYDDPEYLNYTKLNKSRQKRWAKNGVILEETKIVFSNLSTKQHWIIISEPWCGDASHIVAFLVKMAELNPMISYEIQLRDSAPFLIEKYLTNGTKAIPKLIIRDENGNDRAVWGPRPEKAQNMFLSLKEANIEKTEQKIALQNWYNEDEGVAIQKEVCALMK